MLVKYIYIFDAIIFITGLCSFFKNLKNDKTMFNSVISIVIGVFGTLIAHVIYVILDGKLKGNLAIIIFAIMEFIDILLLFKQKTWKAYVVSICVPIVIAVSILYANQQDIQSVFNYSLDTKSNTATINGFSKEYKESRLEIPEYIVKGLKFFKVISIGEKAFYECENLHYVELPNSIKNIENYALAGCKELWSINIPDGLETIGAKAFYNEYFHNTNLENNIKVSENIKIYDDLNTHINYTNLNTNFENGRLLVERSTSKST